MNHINWIDPDILDDNNGKIDGLDEKNEQAFKQFFEIGWQHEKFSHHHDKWRQILTDSDPRARTMAKVAIWSIKNLIESKEKIQILAQPKEQT